MATMTQRPLLLKDYLQQDPFSDSSNGILSFPRRRDSSPTVRHLLEAELSACPRLVRSRSKNALNRLSIIINAVKNLPVSSPSRPSIAKKFSRRFCRSRKKKAEGSKVVTVNDIVRLDSFELYGERRSLCFAATLPVVGGYGSSGGCSEGEGGSFVSSSTSGSLEGTGDGSRGDSSAEKYPNHRRPSSEKEDIENQGMGSEEEKEQLSPISIMDFLEEDDDEEEEEDEDEEVTSDEIVAWGLIRRLRSHYHVDPRSEKLLLDFLMEGLSPPVGDIQRLLITAGDWINGRGFLDVEENDKGRLNEMERNGRWRLIEDGKGYVATDVEVGVLESLIQELVIDLGMG